MMNDMPVLTVRSRAMVTATYGDSAIAGIPMMLSMMTGEGSGMGGWRRTVKDFYRKCSVHPPLPRTQQMSVDPTSLQALARARGVES